jgi:Shedu protein SduA, C-terminal
MPAVLIADYGISPPAFSPEVEPALRARGFSIIKSPSFEDAPNTLEMVANSGGKIDAVLFVLNRQPIDRPFLIQQGHASTIYAAVFRIRKMPDNLCFHHQIRVKTTPTAFLTLFRSRYDAEACNPNVNDFQWFIERTASFDDAPTAALDILKTAIRQWRADFFEELERIGYAVTIGNDGRHHVGHALVRRKKDSEFLHSSASVEQLRRDHVYIASSDVLEDARPLKELEFLLDHCEAMASKARTKPEELLQRFFEKYPRMIYRNNYRRHWSKPRLEIPEGGSYIPDFVMEPAVANRFGPNWEILDLKLPSVPLLERRKFHRNLSGSVVHAIKQLHDYREHFNRKDVKADLEQKFGIAPTNPHLAVIIGRRPSEEDGAILAEAQGKHPALDVELLTYDDVLDFEQERMRLELDLFPID